MKTTLRVLGSLTLLVISVLVMCLMLGKVADWIAVVVFDLFALASYIVLFAVGPKKRGKTNIEFAQELLEKAKNMHRYPMWLYYRREFEERLALGNYNFEKGRITDAIVYLQYALDYGERGMKPLEPLADLA
ncbi:MAG: hypothetical protein COX90_03050 [Candidatus Nealsonbacteria bacterium CG_4_10_14_0_2_um_filter_38_17]|uniref:Uncharacterized protein n=2 Tax=Candidatus Nealsoniibacteriota TaxID=1817911 RepID=A0A2M7UXP3_9BACT|nr:MAG: hypothetical protein COX36_01095 [Candidatus Nealsonbacteria bacterium CG23_combo_of_CG06-09_8_20_14_all_38_19]PIZ88739.1 MAG: hypothetical protein COX90_03050 [Candidatus Nealsonbacteria bacterium CG_4_10_14_0_2_um_filter_38_17]